MRYSRPLWGIAVLVLGIAGCHAQARSDHAAPPATTASTVTGGGADAGDKSYDRAAQQNASANLKTDPAAGSQAGVIEPDQNDGQALAPGANAPQPSHH